MVVEILLLLLVAWLVWKYLLGGSGDGGAAGKGMMSKAIPEFARFPDKYANLEDLQAALQREGLESCNLIIGIDFTQSNTSQGQRTFGGRSLHHLSGGFQNPYQQVISIVGRTLQRFDEDGLIPVFGFGDMSTKDRAVFPFYSDRPCCGFEEVLSRYAEIVPERRLSGPTSFAPLIDRAVQIVDESGGQYHILLIIADGQVTVEGPTIEAIRRASNYPLSIVVVGVGDGPWGQMEEFDDRVARRRFDNFQFVEYNGVQAARNADVQFALRALMEIPQQYAAIKQLGLLGTTAEERSGTGKPKRL
eukprot:TRINITY_DN1662_c4_g1_i1.p2 TRINITY_DN1662_c4_g1~~TRINITY_DN1662_c4_g1_i1.p2  ORF type:complete len:304 (-),score=74.90 TRINITY_DN1662_c4_g1_i1:189-1100(-)